MHIKDVAETAFGAIVAFACTIGAAVLTGLVFAVVGFTTYSTFRWLCGLWGI